MSKLRSFKRHLDPKKVWLAQQVAEEKIKIARQVVLDRAKKDAEFAAEVLKAVGDNLPKEIKEACEASVAGLPSEADPNVTDAELQEVANKEVETLLTELQAERTGPIVGGDTTDQLVPIQLDGGGTVLVHETEAPGYIMDGPDSAILPEKLVQMDGPKAEKA